MASLSNNSSFQKWELSPQELLQGSILTITQKQCIQNQIAAAAERKISLNYNPQDPQTYIQEQAELQGTIGALKYLLDLSAASEQQILNPSEGD